MFACDNQHQLLIRITVKQQSKLNKRTMFKSGTESMERFIHNQWLHKAARLNLSMGPQLRSKVHIYSNFSLEMPNREGITSHTKWLAKSSEFDLHKPCLQPLSSHHNTVSKSV